MGELGEILTTDGCKVLVREATVRDAEQLVAGANGCHG